MLEMRNLIATSMDGRSFLGTLARARSRTRARVFLHRTYFRGGAGRARSFPMRPGRPTRTLLPARTQPRFVCHATPAKHGMNGASSRLIPTNRSSIGIDSAFAEVRPSPWRQAVDLANMMLVLGLRTDAERVYRRARLQFSDEEIAEAFAATRGLTMPSQLRRMLRQQGRDLHGDFLRLLPYRLPPVRIQRWTWRRVGLSPSRSPLGAVVANRPRPAQSPL